MSMINLVCNKQEDTLQSVEDSESSLGILQTPQKKFLTEEISQKSISDKENIRGSYKKFSHSKKLQAINMALKTNDYKKTADLMDVPRKNLKRWIDSTTKTKSNKEIKIEKDVVNWVKEFKKNFD